MGKTPLEDYQIIGFDGLRPAFDPTVLTFWPLFKK